MRLNEVIANYSRNYYFVEVGTIGFLGDEIVRLIEINASPSLVVRVVLGGEAINRRIGLIPSLSSKIGFLICARRDYGMSISLAGIS